MRQPLSPAPPPTGSLLPVIRARVTELFDHRADTRLVYHHEGLAERLQGCLEELLQMTTLGPPARDLALSAVWLWIGGYAVDRRHPAEAAARELERLATTNGFDPAATAHLQRILAEVYHQEPEDAVAQLISDAATVLFLLEYPESAELEWLEDDLYSARTVEPIDWARFELQRLLSLRFYLPATRHRYRSLLSGRILEQRKRTEKLSRRMPEAEPPPPPPAPFAGLEAGPVPVRGAQTFFRAVYRNHINLSAIADNKANILISVNAILISIVITFVSYRNWAETRPIILLPVVLFVVTGLASLVAAILSARPKVTQLNAVGRPPQEVRRNLIFFGNFTHLSREQFEHEIDQVLRSDELIYGNMARDLYHLGRVLDQKYRYLSVAYTLFMVGLIVTVLAFIISLWL